MLTTLLAGALLMDQGRPTTIDKWMPTRWTQDAIEGRGWTEYPRPQLERNLWKSLNGQWEYAIAAQDAAQWPGSQGVIRVPYPVESHLSGVQKPVYPDQTLWYRRTFAVPEAWTGQRIRLNFGAVDWDAQIFVNGQSAGRHTGGYDPFSLDITDKLHSGDNEIVVRVWDPTTDGDQPYGKQALKPQSIWYTAVTGIWQTVWIEPVGPAAFANVHTDTKIDGSIRVVPTVEGAGADQVTAIVHRHGLEVGRGTAAPGQPIDIKIANPLLWHPDHPFLYDLDLELRKGENLLDRARSYFGVREVAIKKDAFGPRIYLNNAPLFMFGPLDQGWWPDGLYTPPTEDAMRFDLEYTKRAGFNTLRKHIKLEPARFYRYCDELGLLVWQDMPSNLKYGPGWNTDWRELNNPKADGPRPAASKAQFEAEWHRILDSARAFTSIVVWVPFNEAWGQFDTKRVAEETKRIDPTRLVNSASGGNFVESGDLLDIHMYPGPGKPAVQPTRAIVNGEFGGLGLPVEGHTWQNRDNWGYQNFKSRDDLSQRYGELIRALTLLKGEGLSAAIYTQTTDVEGEVNGFLTYDRAVSKMPLDFLRGVNQPLYGPEIRMEIKVPTAETVPATWNYTLENPGEDWFKDEFKPVGWSAGKAGFGTRETPGAIVGTEWNAADIWMRREFEIKDRTGDFWIRIFHDEDAEVYINGRAVARLEGYTNAYTWRDIPDGILRNGTNTIAVHVHQTRGGQYIDVGIARAQIHRP